MLYVNNKWDVLATTTSNAIFRKNLALEMRDTDIYEFTTQLEPDLLLRYNGSTYDVTEYGVVECMGGVNEPYTEFYVLAKKSEGQIS